MIRAVNTVSLEYEKQYGQNPLKFSISQLGGAQVGVFLEQSKDPKC